jgi:hypothetical protein
VQVIRLYYMVICLDYGFYDDVDGCDLFSFDIYVLIDVIDEFSLSV